SFRENAASVSRFDVSLVGIYSRIDGAAPDTSAVVNVEFRCSADRAAGVSRFEFKMDRLKDNQVVPFALQSSSLTTSTAKLLRYSRTAPARMVGKSKSGYFREF